MLTLVFNKYLRIESVPKFLVPDKEAYGKPMASGETVAISIV